MTTVIFGANGQDGCYLSEYLSQVKKHDVIGVYRRPSRPVRAYFSALPIKMIEGDVTDYSSVMSILAEYQPEQVYNLAAQSHVHTSFQQPDYTLNATGRGALVILESIRQLKLNSKYYQASTSEMFGSQYTIKKDEQDGSKTIQYVQDENTPLMPNSPYAAAKLYAHNLCRIYRDSYGIFAATGILFNHTSPLRGENFVEKKIAIYVGELMRYLLTINNNDVNKVCDMRDRINSSLPLNIDFPKLKLGNIESYRDIGYAWDYVRAMNLILEHDKPDDFVIATGETYTIEHIVKVMFDWIDIQNYNQFIEIDKSLFRPCEVPYLCGDSTKAKTILNWTPSITFENLMHMLVEDEVDPYGIQYA